jgi:CubicO group peptidase (beta-lactamase class C family)
MRRDTLFRIASMTKPITSVAVLMLVESGELSLDGELSDFVPEFEHVEVLGEDGQRRPLTRPIRVRDLLTHTSGLGYRMQGPPRLSEAYARAGVTDGLSESSLTAAENARRLARAPLLHQPGSAFTYGLSTDVLGYLVERASGQSLSEFLAERVFEPLGMRDTFFHVPPKWRPRLARVYAWSAGTGLRPLEDRPVESGHLIFSPGQCTSEDNRYLSGGAGLVSTARDYLRFARLLDAGGELDGVRLLSPDGVAAMTENQIGELSLPGREKFGYGVSIVDQPNDARGRGSFGWQGFYHTRFWVDPDQHLIGLFLSQQRFDAEPPGDAADDFVQAAYRR